MLPQDKARSANSAQARALRGAIEGAFEDVGGRAWLVSVAREHPQVFVTLLRALIARDLNLGTQGAGEIRIRWVSERDPAEGDAQPEAEQ